MAKEPYKDPFPGLRRPSLFAAETPCHKALREIAELPGSPVTCLSPFGEATEIKPDVTKPVTKPQRVVTKPKAVTKPRGGRPRKGDKPMTSAQRMAAMRAAKKLINI